MTTSSVVDSGDRVDPEAGASFDEFVAARSRALLRTAFLLTHDHALAEDLLQTALAKAWFSWRWIQGEPEPYVRKILVNTYASWWRRKWNGEQPTDALPEDTVEDAGEPTDLWTAMERLPRRMRAVVVLRYFEDLTEVQTAGCSAAPSAPSRARPARRSPGFASIPRSHRKEIRDDLPDRPPQHPRRARRDRG